MRSGNPRPEQALRPYPRTVRALRCCATGRPAAQGDPTAAGEYSGGSAFPLHRPRSRRPGASRCRDQPCVHHSNHQFSRLVQVRESNPRQVSYQLTALPTELTCCSHRHDQAGTRIDDPQRGRRAPVGTHEPEPLAPIDGQQDPAGATPMRGPEIPAGFLGRLSSSKTTRPRRQQPTGALNSSTRGTVVAAPRETSKG